MYLAVSDPVVALLHGRCADSLHFCTENKIVRPAPGVRCCARHFLQLSANKTTVSEVVVGLSNGRCVHLLIFWRLETIVRPPYSGLSLGRMFPALYCVLATGEGLVLAESAWQRLGSCWEGPRRALKPLRTSSEAVRNEP